MNATIPTQSELKASEVECSLWQSLLASTTGSSDGGIPSPAVVLSAASSFGAYEALLDLSTKGAVLPLQYGLVGNQFPVYSLDVRLDDRSLLSKIILPSSSAPPCLYIVDVVVGGDGDRVGAGDIFSSVEAQVHAVWKVLKEEASLDIPPLSFPLNPASSSAVPSSPPPGPLPVLFAVTIDTSLFEGTYVRKQAFAYLTYCLVSYASSLGCGVIFLPSSDGEKETERRAAFRRVVASKAVREDGQGAEEPAEDSDEFYLYLQQGGISKELVEFLRDNSGCKGGWEADCEWSEFVRTVVDGEKVVSRGVGGGGVV